MTSFALRAIALVAMIIDHVGYVFYGSVDWLRIVGRIAFPLYCFLLVQGFRHTRNVGKYALRLAIFALLSEIPYNLLFSGGKLIVPAANNVFFSLLLALGTIYLYKRFLQSRPLIPVLGTFAACILAQVISCDYGFLGILLAVFFYLAEDCKWQQAAALLGALGAYTYIRLITKAASVDWILLQLTCTSALIPILLYNGKPGYRGFKYAFYTLYPAHILLLYCIKNWPKIWVFLQNLKG